VTHALWWRSTLFQGPTYLEHRSTRFPSGSPTFRDHLAEGLTNLERSSTLKHLSPWGLVYLREPSTSGTRLPQGPVYLRDPSTSGTRLPQGPVYLRDSSTLANSLPQGRITMGFCVFGGDLGRRASRAIEVVRSHHPSYARCARSTTSHTSHEEFLPNLTSYKLVHQQAQ